jgi:hypothetical protein
MYWLFLLFALGALAVAFAATSTALLALCLLASLGCLIAWAAGFYGARVGAARRDMGQMIDPAELRRLREQAAARKAAASATAADESPAP